MMTNKAMLERHWLRIEEVTKHKFDVESESFQLRNIMEAPLLEHREDIEVNTCMFEVTTYIVHHCVMILKLHACMMCCYS